ncbi:MAG: alpha/beta fold hydrolase [Candidatus Eisenbacteria bacterium]|nr:alpha/beta fold hydrolase [Candidatus Eisenbacteria bacterium]
MPDWIDRGAYPFESHWVRVGVGELHYIDEGEGRPLVMVHGNPTWSFLYRHLVRDLAPRFRCVAPDHIGFGLSDKPAGWSYRPSEHARNLAALIDRLGLEDITLVVQDWGGPIGLSYALDHPDNVAGVVVLNTWMWPVDDDWYYRAFSGLVGGPVGRFLIRRFNFFARCVMKQTYGDKGRLTREIHEHYLRPLATPDERTACAVLPGEILGATEWLADLWSKRASLREKAALIVWGMKDIAFREKELIRWTEALPQARVIRLPDAGHFIQEEAPERLGEAVGSFLEEVCA